MSIDYTRPVLKDMVDLKWKHGSEIKYYIKTSKTGKKSMVLVAEV